MRIVVTGVNGFVGKYLAQELRKSGLEVIGIGRDTQPAQSIAADLKEYFSADLTKQWPAVHDVAGVIHLAGLAAVAPSFDHPQRYIELNSAMVTNMCEAYMVEKRKPRLLLVSSGAVYDSRQRMPLAEDAAVAFASPYVVSKILVENQASYYRNRGLECVVARPFNHIGPGQKEGFLVPDLVKQLKTIRENGVMKVGNLISARDYTDVRDVARAYRLIATAPSLQHTTYNVCSGKSVPGETLLSSLLQAFGLQGKLKIEVDPDKFRPTDAADICGDFSRLATDLGWQAKISLKQTLSDVYKMSVG